MLFRIKNKYFKINLLLKHLRDHKIEKVKANYFRVKITKYIKNFQFWTLFYLLKSYTTNQKENELLKNRESNKKNEFLRLNKS